MSDGGAGAQGGTRPALEELDEAECLRLIGQGGVGRIAFTGRYGPTVLPVNYRMHDGDIVFRTAQDSATDEDLRTGIEDAAYKVAFEIDSFDDQMHEGWSVLVQGGARHMVGEGEHEEGQSTGVEPWAGGNRDVYVRIIRTRITGRRVSHR